MIFLWSQKTLYLTVVSVRVSLAVTKHHDQEHLMEERGSVYNPQIVSLREVGEGNPGENTEAKADTKAIDKFGSWLVSHGLFRLIS